MKQLLGEENQIGTEEEERRGSDRKGEEEVDLNRDITVEEIKYAIDKIKNGKATGEDGIAAEFLENLPREWLEEITLIVNNIFKGGDMIKGWNVAIIYPIFT